MSQALAKKIALRIPNDIRSKRILSDVDPIKHAIPVQTNMHMMLLAEIWYEFIEPFQERSYCPVCLDNILKNFHAMKPILIEIQKEQNLLSAL